MAMLTTTLMMMTTAMIMLLMLIYANDIDADCSDTDNDYGNRNDFRVMRVCVCVWISIASNYEHTIVHSSIKTT